MKGFDLEKNIGKYQKSSDYFQVKKKKNKNKKKQKKKH